MLSAAGGGAARVLCFGDSLTAGYWANGRRFHPYAGEAKRLLGVPIDHVGLCGSGAYARCAAPAAAADASLLPPLPCLHCSRRPESAWPR